MCLSLVYRFHNKIQIQDDGNRVIQTDTYKIAKSFRYCPEISEGSSLDSSTIIKAKPTTVIAAMAHRVISAAVAKSKSASNGMRSVGLFPTKTGPVLRGFNDPLTSGLFQNVAIMDHVKRTGAPDRRGLIRHDL